AASCVRSTSFPLLSEGVCAIESPVWLLQASPRQNLYAFFSLRHRPHKVILRNLIVLLGLCCAAASAYAQGGPPYYTNDPGTPGNLNWEINTGYMPFYYSNQSVSHVPDLDINFGISDRIQLTYETAWLRVQNPFSQTKFGLNQSNPGVKWRFYL